MAIEEEQRARLRATIELATRIRSTLQPLLDAHGDRVHFRPSSGGVAMIGLLHERPQRGSKRIRDLSRIVASFESLFGQHCRDVEQGRATGEKALQSALIREAYVNGRRLASLNAASTRTDECVDLVFVTDEIGLPVAHETTNKIVCDVLALRRDGGRSTPVLLELKDDRMLSRLVEQVEGYASLIDAHADLFASLYGVLLGEELQFDAPCERWIVWPAARDGDDAPDPHEDQLAAKGIRVVTYVATGAGSYAFRVGRSAAGRNR